MRKKRFGLRASPVAFAAATLLIVAGCASRMQDSPRNAATPPPESEPAPAPAGDQPQQITVYGHASVASSIDEGDSIEEIVTTGSRQSRRTGLFSNRRSFGLHNSDEETYAAAKPLSYSEELWVVSVPANDDQNQTDDDSPGSGSMVATFPGETDERGSTGRMVPLPLQHTAVDARIDGYIGTVSVTQEFANPFDTKIEATYLFPLPEKSAVSEFVMTIGDRKIRGILREKAQAEAIYNEARRQGYQASLLVQHRPNVFEQKVANIEPGKSIDVDIKYFHTLAYEDGWYSFVFPTVVGPRYNPPGSRDPIVAAASGASATSGSPTTVNYLRPDERSAHDISIDVQVNAGVAIEELLASHEIAATRPTPDTAKVTLASGSTMPNKDFVLRFRVAGDTIQSNLVTYQEPGSAEGYFTMMLYPPATSNTLQRRPMEMVFVLDCSGSMDGKPLNQSKAAVSAALDELRPSDTFQIIRFSDDSSSFGPTPVAATKENLRMARRYLKNLDSMGGTQMIEGVKAALNFPHDPRRLRFVSFMTDGYIGNEVDIIAAVHEYIGESRVFSFGVGSSVNRYLLERMAKVGKGAVAYLGPRDSASDLMSNFFGRISRPALTDLSIDWGGMAVSDVYPAKIPDLFVGRSVVITGKYSGTPGAVSVTGYAGTTHDQFDVLPAANDSPSPSVAKIWARLKIAELADRKTWETDTYDDLGEAIKQTALEHQLVSDYTSFIAVDASQRTQGGYGVTVPQAVPVPDGVRYETTVEDQGGRAQ